MAKHYFSAQNFSLADVSKKLVMFFKERDFEVEDAEGDGVHLIQAKKTSGWRTLVGANQAFKIRLFSQEPGEITLDCEIGEWASNLAGAGVTALFTGGLTIVTGAVGVAWAHKIESEVCDYIEMSLKFKHKNVVNNPTHIASGNAKNDSPQISMAIPVNSDDKSLPTGNLKQLSPREKAAIMVQRDIEKFKKALDDGVFSPEEYAFKKQNAEKNIDEYEVQILVEENTPKLKEALNNGILSPEEYHEKLSSMAKNLKIKIAQERKDNEVNEKANKLKAALEAGILSQEEYNQKISNL